MLHVIIFLIHPGGVSLIKKLFSRENLWALILFLIVVVLVVVSASMAPLWIYQGF
jgi:hypothetical protein